jgi:hypothetical protein
MSLLMGRRGPPEGARKPADSPPRSAGVPLARASEPHQLGSVTLDNVDRIAGMSAAEIERIADQLMVAAQETADTLREAARRMRHAGLVANERLANFVRVATTCTDAAKMMQASVDRRDDKPAPPEDAPRMHQETNASGVAVDLVKLEGEIIPRDAS